MGWTQSPPAFCAVTETIADVANEQLHKRRKAPRHCLDTQADSPSTDHVHLPSPRQTPVTLPSPNPNIRRYQRKLATVDVFVDDFIAAAQGSTQRLNRVRRILMRAIDDVFRPLSPDDPIHRTEPMSVKKLLKGDASWSTCKKVLGWIIDTVSMTLTLSERRLQRLADILATIPSTKKRLVIDKWYKLLGELRSMVIALPSARGLFSHLQSALRTQQQHRLRLSAGFHAALDDFRWLHQNLGDRPTRLQELVPTAPTLIGTHDAAGHGAGGVWFPQPSAVPRPTKLTVLECDDHLHRVRARRSAPMVWRVPFPQDIQRRLVSFRNPGGDINNSQLELAGSYLHNEEAAQCFDIRERTIKSGTDNIATMYWNRKGSVTTTSPTATLLRQQALHQRHHRYLPLSDYIPGPENQMSDYASRYQHLSDAAFLAHFNTQYPQSVPWRLFHHRPTTILSATSALRNKMSPTALYLHEPTPPRPTGPSGLNFAPPFQSILPYKTSPTLSPTSKFSHTDIAEASLTLPDGKSGAVRSVGQTFAAVGSPT